MASGGAGGAGGASPCGACKFLRRKCASDCVFAPYFRSEQGAARFAAVHKVFGASNAAKLLLHVPPAERCEAVVTIAYEAQARLQDPVYGCVARIFALQQQVASLQLQLMQIKGQIAQRMIRLQSSSSSSSGSQSQGIIMNDQYGSINPNLLLQGHSGISSCCVWESMSSSSSSSTSSQSLINGANYLPVQGVLFKEDLISKESRSGSNSDKRSWTVMHGDQMGELQDYLAFRMLGN